MRSSAPSVFSSAPPARALDQISPLDRVIEPAEELLHLYRIRYRLPSRCLGLLLAAMPLRGCLPVVLTAMLLARLLAALLRLLVTLLSLTSVLL